jgi:preprotein translocase subunit SecY
VKKLIQTFKNIWSIDELKNKILFTLLLVGIYRIGSHIVLPGIDATSIKTGGSSNGLLGLIDSFSGGAFNNASIFALGIMPYISASIFMQLVTVLVPTFQKCKRKVKVVRKNQSVHPLSYSCRYVGTSISLR